MLKRAHFEILSSTCRKIIFHPVEQ